MRLSKLGWVAIAATFLLAGLGVFLFFGVDRGERKLADGSVLRLAKVHYGKWEHLSLAGVMEQLKARLPYSWQSHLGKPATPRGSSSWWQNTTMHTNEDALYIYLTRLDAATGAYRSVDATSVELVDDEGCVFLPTQAGGEDDGRLYSLSPTPARTRMGQGYSVGWFRFEAFPRHQGKFRLRVFEESQTGELGAPLTELTVQNPAPPPAPTNWPTQPLPITNTLGDVSFVLTELRVKTNFTHHQPHYGYPLNLAPLYRIFEGGQTTSNWEALDSELFDSSGNFASKMYGVEAGYLSPRESAWKLRVRFFASEASSAASNTTWTLKGIEIPARGQFTNLQASRDLQGITVRVRAFAAPGNFAYTNGLTVALPESDLPKGENTVNTTWASNSRGSSSPNYTVHGQAPHLMFEIGLLTDDQRLTIRATDDQGRVYYAYKWNNWGATPRVKGEPDKIRYLEKQYGMNEASFVSFDLPADAKRVDITFCIHSAAISEFIFKPPVP